MSGYSFVARLLPDPLVWIWLSTEVSGSYDGCLYPPVDALLHFDADGALSMVGSSKHVLSAHLGAQRSHLLQSE